MLGCKYIIGLLGSVVMVELIDTCWDVNYSIPSAVDADLKELIDTCWDVNAVNF